MSADFNLDQTLQRAVNTLATRSPAEISWKAKVSFDEKEKCFTVTFLNQVFQISFPEGQVCYRNDQRQPDLVMQILLLHYLTHAQGEPLAQRWISFKELPGGDIYAGPFHNRAIIPLVKAFGDDPTRLLKASEPVNGQPAPLGDLSVVLFPLPMIPVSLVLWEGDDEFPPSGNVLFDASAPSYLPTEDFAFLVSIVVNTLARIDKGIDK